MIIVLFNRQEITITKEEAERIDELIDQDVKWLKIGEFRVRPSAIAMIKPGGYTEVDIVPEGRRLARPDYRGQPSPALEKLREKWGNPNVPKGQQ